MAIGSTSSSQEGPHPAGRWLLPSIGDLLFIALLGVLAFTALSTRLLGDAGIGWHIRTGQLILTTHTVPRADPFSSTMAGRPWFAWEWLYDVLVGWLERAAGLNGVVLFTATVIALTFSWAYRLLIRRGTNFLVALILVLLAASASMIHFLARPHVVSWLFTVTWFFILDSSQQRTQGLRFDVREEVKRDRRLWLLPLLMLVWVNVHGGFLLGFALLGIYWLSAVSQYFRLDDSHFEGALRKIRAGKRVRTIAFVTTASALATLLNPYGWKLHVHIYRYLSNRFLMDHIDEFQSPNFHGIAQKCFAGLLLLSILALVSGRRDRRSVPLSETLLILFAVYTGLYASRNIPLSSLLLILVVGPLLSEVLEHFARAIHRRRAALTLPQQNSAPFLRRMGAIQSGLRGHLWPVAAFAVAWVFVFHGGMLGNRSLMSAHFDSKRFPARAIDHLHEHNLQSPIFAPDYWGGYLIYRLYPQAQVAVDDRHDFYGEKFLKSYLKMVHVEPGWNEFLDQYPVRSLIVPKDSALASILGETPLWQPVYSDEVAIVFIPNPTASQ